MSNLAPKKPKKVLFLITKSNWGGAQRYVYDLTSNLPKDAYEVVVALGGTGELKTRLEAEGIRVISITSLQRDVSLVKEFHSARELYQILRREQPDILHINSSKAGVIGAYVGRLARVPQIIFTAHGWAFNEDRSWLQRTVIKLFHWTTVILSHQTIAVSAGLKAQLNWPLAQNKMTVINPGRAPISFIPRADARGVLGERVSSTIPSEALLIGSIGELHPIKRFSLLLQAFSKLPTKAAAYMCLVGEGEERSTLERIIRENNLSERVFLTGAIPEASKLLQAFDIFVLPSKSESFGYVLIEAGLAGVPIIASRVGGIPDIIKNENQGLLFESENLSELTAKLQYLSDNAAARKSIGEGARARAGEFSIPQMIQKTIALYEASSSRD